MNKQAVPVPMPREPGIYRREGARGTRYLVRFRDPNGKQVWKTLGTLKDARAFRDDARSSVRRGTYVDPHERATVAEYARTYVDSRSHEQRPATRARQLSMITTHLDGTQLGQTPLTKVRREHVDAWLVDRRQHLSRSTLRIVASLVRATFRYAVENGRLVTAPVVRVGKADEHDAAERVVPPTVDEVQRLAAAMPNETYRALVLVQAGTGLRVSELLGLRVRDVSTTFRVVNVDSQLSRTGERIATKTPESVRTVPLPQALVPVLEDLQPKGAGPDALLFTRRGAAVRQNSYHVAFKAGVQRAGLRSTLSSHDLRHHYATTLLRAGMSPVAVGRLLGHTDGALVVKTYAHWMPADDDLARRALDSAWGEATHVRAVAL